MDENGLAQASLQKRLSESLNQDKKKVIIESHLAPGDILMLSSAIRDLVKSHGHKFAVDVRTSVPSLFENNPYITKIPYKDADITIDAGYPLVHKSNQYAYHFIHGYAIDIEKKLRVRIPITDFKGDIHISDEEKSWFSQVYEVTGEDRKFWIIDAGGKFDFTSKWAPPSLYQAVVSAFPEITFVQVGAPNHWHPPLKGDNVINLVGKTNIRELVRLVYHSVGVITPISFPMHLAAAVESRYGVEKRPCIVLAGGREPRHWEAYPNHVYFDKVGQYSCCRDGACWKTRCTEIKDDLYAEGSKVLEENQEKNKKLCEKRVYIRKANSKREKKFFDELYVPQCLYDIKPKEIIQAIENYYDAGSAIL